MVNGAVLGIDLGANSVGTALIFPALQEVRFTGVRIFPISGGNEPGAFGDGKDKPANQDRRDARQQRKQTDRRKRRQLKVFHLLQRYSLLPAGDANASILALDRELQRKYSQSSIVPYFLRAKALDEKLEVHELGRALFHLAQRRGFLSNRKMAPKGDEDLGLIKGAIEGLEREIRNAGKRTLGEFFASLDPHENSIRNHITHNSKHYTHRSMFEHEFSAIWQAQAAHHPHLLTAERFAELHHAMFYQRPLKDQSDLVGDCELEKNSKRAPMRLIAVQHFRLLTAMNNLRLITEAGNERPFTQEERAKLLAMATFEQKVTYANIKKHLGLPKATKFTQEEGGETKLLGNLTVARLAEIFNLRWQDLSADEQNDLVEDVGDGKRHPTDESLYACAREKWGLSEEQAKQIERTRLQDGYFSISLPAVEKMMPLLEQGIAYSQARRIAYPEQFAAASPLPLLPPVKCALPEVRNPIVLRALTELRKTVNAIVRRHGLPEFIHIELARDLKKSRDQRMKDTAKNRDLEKQRDQARGALQAHGIPSPSRRDIEKYRLYEECRHECPYTGKTISLNSLFGANPQFDVEHIVPFSRSLDDSYFNKTLCHREANHEKGNRTPWEAFGGSSQWDQMLAAVKKFNNSSKMQRFVMTETDTAKLLEEFSTRQLNDTRYASKLAAKYLGMLYGGKVDAGGTLRVITCAGGVTAFLRQKWDLNRILNEKPEKSRDDHRHHAVDAVAIAMASQGQVKALADAARRANAEGHRRFGSFAYPWPEFTDCVREKIASTVVSLRPVRTLQGAFHDETLYSRARKEADGREYVHVRKRVDSLTSEAAIEEIVDPTVRAAVREKFLEVSKDVKKYADNPPTLRTKTGKEIKIYRARVRKSASVKQIGSGPTARNIVPNGNHHMAVWAELGADEKPKRWFYEVVTRLEANLRHANACPVVQRERGPQTRFEFTLSEGDMVQARKSGGQPLIVWRVRSVKENGQLVLSPASDARLKEEIRLGRDLWSPVLNGFMKGGGRKIRVTHLGEIEACCD